MVDEPMKIWDNFDPETETEPEGKNTELSLLFDRESASRRWERTHAANWEAPLDNEHCEQLTLFVWKDNTQAFNI